MGGLVEAVRGALAPGRGIVAVSGGADSVALLRSITACGYAPLAAHVNHQLRGAESDEDERFVQQLADSLGVPFRCVRIDTRSHGGNLEAIARRLRYQWLHELANETCAAWIATAHTADDQAETVMHRLIRGTGLQGLRGIAAESPPTAVGGLLLRPLITVTRQEVLQYLQSLNQRFRTDSTNADLRFTRNRIRAELVPLLRSFNPEVVPVLGRLAQQADETFRFIEAQAAALLQSAEKPRAGSTIILDRAVLLAASPVLVRSALRLIWEREGWPLGEMDFDHWDAAARLAPRDFPGGVTLRCAGRVVQLARSS
jgi:tRNA(Ile)-lysidine synthase